jgi:hypothetical protein
MSRSSPGCAASEAPVDFEKVGNSWRTTASTRDRNRTARQGPAAIVDSLKKMLGTVTKAEFEIVQTCAGMVVNERSSFTMPQQAWSGTASVCSATARSRSGTLR